MRQNLYLIVIIASLCGNLAYGFSISHHRPRNGRSFTCSLSGHSGVDKGETGGIKRYLGYLMVLYVSIMPTSVPVGRVVGARMASAEMSAVLAAEKVDPISASIEKKIKEDSLVESKAILTSESDKTDTGIPGVSEDVERELESLEEDMEMNILRRKRRSDQVMINMKKALAKAAKDGASIDVEKGFTSEQQKFLDNCRDRVLTLQAYLDEARRDMVSRNWKNLQVYIFTFAEQEDAFVGLINGLFPQDDPLDRAAREALSFEAQSMFVNLDDLREAAKAGNVPKAQKAFASLLLSYDRFLKAGDMYDTYDPITSTAIFLKINPCRPWSLIRKLKCKYMTVCCFLVGQIWAKRAL